MAKNKLESKFSAGGPAYNPLYKQVQDYLTQLIIEQRWKAGEMLPNEFQLADEFGVSQGTVRKALNALTDAKILYRRQGVGTFVSEHTEQQALYRFFPIVADGKPPELPMSETMERCQTIADEEVAKQLQVKVGEPVIMLSRKRNISGVLCILEDIYLPFDHFKGMLDEPEIPHTLYHFYQTNYRQTVHQITDRVKAVMPSEADAATLGVPVSEPLLFFTRVTKSLQGKVIEYRQTRCRSDHYHYLVDLS